MMTDKVNGAIAYALEELGKDYLFQQMKKIHRDRFERLSKSLDLQRFDLDFHGQFGEDAYMANHEGGMYVLYTHVVETIEKLLKEIANLSNDLHTEKESCSLLEESNKRLGNQLTEIANELHDTKLKFDCYKKFIDFEIYELEENIKKLQGENK